MSFLHWASPSFSQCTWCPHIALRGLRHLLDLCAQPTSRARKPPWSARQPPSTGSRPGTLHLSRCRGFAVSDDISFHPLISFEPLSCWTNQIIITWGSFYASLLHALCHWESLVDCYLDFKNSHSIQNTLYICIIILPQLVPPKNKLTGNLMS